MLSQALYWSERTDDPQGWFYKTQHQWTEEICLTRSEQQTARRILRKFDFWRERRFGIPAKLYFRLDYEKLAAAIGQYAENLPTCLLQFSGQVSCENKDNPVGKNKTSRLETGEQKQQRLPETTPEITQRAEVPRTDSTSGWSRTRRTQMPAGFTPHNDHERLASELGVDLDQAFRAFTDYHISKGSAFVDWGRALNTWLRNEHKFSGNNRKGAPYGNRAEHRQAENIAAGNAAIAIVQRRMAD